MKKKPSNELNNPQKIYKYKKKTLKQNRQKKKTLNVVYSFASETSDALIVPDFH